MIINCPECSTGFKLPDERITPKGTKLKCSRCDHVFRVREGDDGEPEIFYRPHDNKGEGGAKKSAAKSSPFPHSGGLSGLKPKKKSAFGSLNSDADEGAEDEALELAEVSEAEVMENADADDDVAALTGSGDSAFGDPSEHVDPSFGDDGPYFDPKEGKVDSSSANKAPQDKRAGGPPPGAAAAGPPPTAAASRPPASSSAPETKQAPPASAPKTWDDEDLAPHKIGGGMGRKFVNLLFVLLLVGAGFLGTVAYLNDGFLDFKAFGQMIEVAFDDGEYEPRQEWLGGGAPTIVMSSEEALEVESVYGELVRTAGGDDVFVVRGMVRNHQEERARDIELRAIISSPEGRALSEIAGSAGADVAVGQVRELRDLDDLPEMMDVDEAVIEAGRAAPFTLVFEDVPSRVGEGERFSFRVDVVDGPEGTDPVAAQE